MLSPIENPEFDPDLSPGPGPVTLAAIIAAFLGIACIIALADPLEPATLSAQHSESGA
jgi:hypothetical protein